jgi:beta-galactosidase
LDYIDAVRPWHHALLNLGVTTDFVHAHSDLAAYSLVIVPMLFVADEPTLARFDSFVERGGTLLVTALTGVTDANAAFHPGGPLGSLASTLGVRVEEYAPHNSAESVSVEGGVTFSTTQWAEVMHAEEAEVLATFRGGLADGGPALTRKRNRKGNAWYLAADATEAAARAVLELILTTVSDPVIRADGSLPLGVEEVRRGTLTFLISHRQDAVRLPRAGYDVLADTAVEEIVLEAHGVAVLAGAQPQATGPDRADPLGNPSH